MYVRYFMRQTRSRSKVQAFVVSCGALQGSESLCFCSPWHRTLDLNQIIHPHMKWSSAVQTIAKQGGVTQTSNVDMRECMRR